MNPAATITTVINAAATRHSKPVDPLSLLDIAQTFNQNQLRARLNAVIAWHLHQNHDLAVHIIAKAYKLSWVTIHNRINKGRKLIKRSPWRETYQALP